MYHKVSNSVYVSDVELSLSDYIKGRQLYFSERHKTPCIKCESMHCVTQVVHTAGYCSLPHAFKIASPGVKYMAEKARRLLLQMTLVSIWIGNPDKGNLFSIVTEHCHRVDYSKLSLVLHGLLKSCVNLNPQGLIKRCVKMLLSLRSADREREVMMHAIFKASGIFVSKAQHLYGFELDRALSTGRRSCIVEDRRIHVEDTAMIEDKALPASFHIGQSSNSDETDLDDEQVPTSLCKLSSNLLGLC